MTAASVASRARTRRWARLLLISGLVGLNAIAMLNVVREIFSISPGAALAHVGTDWLNFGAAAGQIGQGLSPYNVTTYRWTPTAAYLLIPVTLLPWWAWQLLHVAGALALPSWRLRALVLLSYPWWYDLVTGNLMFLVLLPAAWALRGSRVGIGTFLALTWLIPRPLMIPVAALLLVRHREWRLPFAVMGVLVLVSSAASGFGFEFLQRMVDSSSEVSMGQNMAPSSVFGLWWAPIGLVLAALFFRFGRIGLASLAIQPYWIPNYLLMGFLEMPEVRATAQDRQPPP